MVPGGSALSDRWRAQRLSQLPPYLFIEIDRFKAAARAAGRDVIDLGVGDPDHPTPQFIVEAMERAIREPANHRYALGTGKPEFKQSVASFCRRRFGIDLDPASEVLALLGTKEGIGHLPAALVDPGDVVLVPQPGYPAYAGGTVLAGGTCHTLPLSADRGWLPALDEIPEEVCERAKILYLNYPNNPTSACATLPFFERAVAFAKQHDILLVQDAAYSEIYYGAAPPAALQIPGAKDVCIEFHSLSKTFNMCGWRIGFAVGNAGALAALAKVKSNLDSGVFGAVQAAAIEALDHNDNVEVRAQTDVYRRRRDLVVEGLRKLGFQVDPPAATFYVWARTPGSLPTMDLCKRVIEEAGVVLIPGGGFGPCGEGYVRLALTVDEPRLQEALDRLSNISW